MTIKTLKITSDCSANTNSNAISSDMHKPKKSGAARNLFGTSVDRDELQQQIKMVDRNGRWALGNYKIESKIQEIKRDDDHQARRLKYQPAKQIEKDRKPQKSTSQSIIDSMIMSRDASSSSSLSKSSLPSASKVLSVQRPASTNPALSKGQRTIKDYYQSVKRSRQDR